MIYATASSNVVRHVIKISCGRRNVHVSSGWWNIHVPYNTSHTYPFST